MFVEFAQFPRQLESWVVQKQNSGWNWDRVWKKQWFFSWRGNRQRHFLCWVQRKGINLSTIVKVVTERPEGRQMGIYCLAYLVLVWELKFEAILSLRRKPTTRSLARYFCSFHPVTLVGVPSSSAGSNVFEEFEQYLGLELIRVDSTIFPLDFGSSHWREWPTKSSIEEASWFGDHVACESILSCLVTEPLPRVYQSWLSSGRLRDMRSL